jgi:hypothetical protein
MSELREKRIQQHQAMAESYNLGTLYSKVLDHMSKNPQYNSVKFAEACKELDELYFEDFVVPILDTLHKTYDEMPDIFKLNGGTFYKNPEIDYKIIPTLFNVKPSAGKIDKDTTWRRGTEGLQEWKDTEEEKEKKLEKKMSLLFQRLDMIEKSEDYKRAEQELAVLSKATTVTKERTDEDRENENKADAIIGHFTTGANMVVSYKWLIENLPSENGDEVKKVCEKMIQLYDENFIEPCLGVYGCPATKQELGEPVKSTLDSDYEFNLHPIMEFDSTTQFININVEQNENYTYSYNIHLGEDEDEEMDVGEWAKGRLKKYEKDYGESVDYLKKNLVKLAMIDA